MGALLVASCAKGKPKESDAAADQDAQDVFQEGADYEGDDAGQGDIPLDRGEVFRAARTAGGGSVGFESYNLEVFTAPGRPAGNVSTPGYKLKLGPAAAKGE